MNLLAEVGLADHAHDDSAIVAMLLKGRCRDASLWRYLGPARSWLRYCADRGESPHDASTAALLRWLDSRVRNSAAPGSCIKMSLAAARFVQRGRCVVLGVEAVPYTPRARIQLDAWIGAFASLETRPATMARPLRLDELAELVRMVGRDTHARRAIDAETARALAVRDVAMLLVGWWAAFRADDLARLRWEHVHFVVKGAELELPTSKTTWAHLALARRDDRPDLCPVRALRDLGEGRALVGNVFGLLAGQHVGRRVKVLFARHGVPRGYSSHSLRAGFATEAASQNVSDRLVQKHGRWLSVQQHAEYVRAGRLWLDTPTLPERIACPPPPVPTHPASESKVAGVAFDVASTSERHSTNQGT